MFVLCSPRKVKSYETGHCLGLIFILGLHVGPRVLGAPAIWTGGHPAYESKDYSPTMKRLTERSVEAVAEPLRWYQ